MKFRLKYLAMLALVVGVSATSAHAAAGDPSAYVAQVTATATQMVTDAAIIITAGLGLFAVRYGIRWGIGLFKSTTK